MRHIRQRLITFSNDHCILASPAGRGEHAVPIQTKIKNNALGALLS